MNFARSEEPMPFFGPAPSALLEGLTDRSDLELHIVACSRKKMRAPEKLGPNIWYHLLHVPRLTSARFLYAGRIAAIQKKLRAIAPELVHGQGTERYCGLAAALSGFPNVITIHGNMSGMVRARAAGFGSYYWLAARLESFAVRRTCGIFCNSAYTKSQVERKARRTWDVPNALRNVFFKPIPPKPRNPEALILNIGSIAAHKRQLQILSAARKAFEDGARFRLRFIGASADTKYARQFHDALSRVENAAFASYQTPAGINQLLAAYDQADALVHFPSEEAFGLVVAEALARNLKLFAARTGGIPDISAGVDSAELFDPQDWSGLSTAVIDWVKRGRETRASAADEMKRRYSPTVIADIHLKIYDEIVSGRLGSNV